MPVILRDRGFEAEAVLCESSKDLKEAKANIWTVKSKLRDAADAAYADAAAAYAAYAAAGADADADKYLLISANICLEALKELKSPGVEFLYLCD
jgi:hypothetical protein